VVAVLVVKVVVPTVQVVVIIVVKPAVGLAVLPAVLVVVVLVVVILVAAHANGGLQSISLLLCADLLQRQTHNCAKHRLKFIGAFMSNTAFTITWLSVNTLLYTSPAAP
jgi:hypothetical protein